MAILSSETFYLILLSWIGLVWVKRALWMTRFRKTHPPLAPVSASTHPSPLVSVIVPARDEEKNISNCLTHLASQSYPNYEIVVVDDRSQDKTPQFIGEFSRQTKARLKMVRVEKLPQGWTGKNYAMFTGSKAANGEFFLFTDADTTHSPESLQTAMACVLERKIDLLTLAPEIESKSFWEKTVQPLAVSSLALWFNPQKVNAPQNKTVLANGQFILIKKEVYEKVGGNEAVKTEVVEDVALAKNVKEAGYLVQFLNGTCLYSTRMYTSLKEIKTGWTRIFTYLFNKNVPAILHKIFLFLFFSMLPFFIWLVEAAIGAGAPQYFYKSVFILSSVVCAVIIVIRYFGNKSLKSEGWYAVFHLLGSVVMVWILSACIGRILFKRASVWRGEYYR